MSLGAYDAKSVAIFFMLRHPLQLSKSAVLIANKMRLLRLRNHQEVIERIINSAKASLTLTLITGSAKAQCGVN